MNGLNEEKSFVYNIGLWVMGVKLRTHMFQTILKLNVAYLMKVYSKRTENNMRKGESASYFSLVVFKGLLPHFHENLGLCGKYLIYKM